MNDLLHKSAANDEVIEYRIRQKWGGAVGQGGLIGFLALPEVLIRGQKRLGLNSTEMMVLINILLHWWRVDKKPFVGNATIAKRMGVDTRTVQRACVKLEKKGLIRRDIHRFHDKETGQHSATRSIDVTGLVNRLKVFAQDFSDYARTAREEKAAQRQSTKG